MQRRDFFKMVSGATVGTLVHCLPALAQQSVGIPTIGVLWHAGNGNEEQPYFDALMSGFRDLGYVEGRNIKFEHRFPNEIPERFQQMATELVSLNVTAIVTVGNIT